ncbi:MAG TPA: molybdate ABC transporter substrate-binding protein [Rubellimicrobium sp.]|nr:molybdate ABC transporter substrate-binding protein [Rubellimicrobium sp.]
MLRATLAALLLATPAQADGFNVFAAASLAGALDAVAQEWAEGTGQEPVLIYASTAQLARQIEAGAPADLFVSASPDWMDALEEGGFLVPDSRRAILGNSLVLVAHGPSTSQEIGPDLDLAAMLDGGRLAMALVDAVPAGVYGKQALTSLGLWDSVASSVAQADDVRGALALVASGEAPLGIVYATDARAEPRVSVVGTFPEASHDPIVYSAALVAGRENDEAHDFLLHLGHDTSRAIFEAQGFTVLR